MLTFLYVIYVASVAACLVGPILDVAKEIINITLYPFLGYKYYGKINAPSIFSAIVLALTPLLNTLVALVELRRAAIQLLKRI